MTHRLTEHQQVPLTKTERAELRQQAARRDVTPGIFTRALVLAGLCKLGEPALEHAIDEEKKASAQRFSASATVAANRRWEKKA